MLDQDIVRGKILQFEQELGKLPSALAELPVTHRFAPGIYTREIFIPKGICVVGMIHRHAHLNIISQGKCSVFTEFNGTEHLQAHCSFVSRPETKRIVVAHEDVIWTTIHENADNETDIDKLVDRITWPTYDALLSLEAGLPPLLGMEDA